MKRPLPVDNLKEQLRGASLREQFEEFVAEFGGQMEEHMIMGWVKGVRDEIPKVTRLARDPEDNVQQMQEKLGTLLQNFPDKN